MAQIINLDFIQIPKGELPITRRFIDTVNESPTTEPAHVLEAALKANIEALATIEMRIKAVVRAAGLVDNFEVHD